jgi:hypothetical protein
MRPLLLATLVAALFTGCNRHTQQGATDTGKVRVGYIASVTSV